MALFVKEIAPRRSKVYQVLPSRWLKLDQHSARSSKNISSGLDNNSKTGTRPPRIGGRYHQ
ncbi:hypothetical protein Slin15195_G057300 [Septoria linicola]|uniref:Uncharacterized protein n=1 Tax=Septoria linicola TaxID=215465 RepID=A0A9Q9EI34_9PEZI|nr:hypothetical protein Slin14017_G073170 [Septoria linicola]USW52411.1 hypothetical protein Slin15195_G057300 [Septoria linicola]